MLDIAKYYSIDELEKINKKKKGNKLIESTATPLSNDDVYNQGLIEGGVGVDPTIQLIMDQSMGKPVTQGQMYHGVSSSGMQVMKS